MKKKIILGFLLSAAFGFFVFGGDVSAMVVQATATATFIPPSVTATLFDDDCPVGTPAGWGTYTPSSLWMIECGDCGVITSTPILSPTPTATGTPPTSTATVSPTPSTGGLTCGALQKQSAGELGTCEVLEDGRKLRYYIQTAQYANENLLVKLTQPNGILYNNLSGRIVVVGQGRTVAAGSDHPYTFQNQVTNAWLSPSWTELTHEMIHMWIWDNSFLFRNNYSTSISFYQLASYDDLADIGLLIEIYAPGYVPVVPTATPTPYFDTGYCSSVAPVLDDFGFDLFSNDGSPNCDMGWDEFTVGETTVSAVQICLQPVQVGVIRLFGTDYEMGIFFLAVGAAFFWRYMRTV